MYSDIQICVILTLYPDDEDDEEEDGEDEEEVDEEEEEDDDVYDLTNHCDA